MKILYGVSGEGLGHSSRAKRVIPYLKKKGYDVLVVTYGQAYKVLKSEFEVLKVEGAELHFRKGGLSLSKTFVKNLGAVGKNIRRGRGIWKRVRGFKPDVCISDFEPIVPMLSHHMKLPLISFDNQHRLTHSKIDVPKKYKKDFFIARSAVNIVISRADAFIILSFNKGKNKKGVYMVDPILREEIVRLKPKRENYVLVYLTKGDERIIEVLKGIDQRFIVYGYDKVGKDGNLEFRKTGNKFIDDLKDCKAIIASAGFTLMSEALYLKKPYFAIPLKGQFEQTLNALFLEKARYGEFSEEPTEKDVRMFLSKLDFYEKKLRKHKMDPDDAVETLGRVLEGLE